MVELATGVGAFVVGVVVGFAVARRDRPFRVDWHFVLENDGREPDGPEKSCE